MGKISRKIAGVLLASTTWAGIVLMNRVIETIGLDVAFENYAQVYLLVAISVIYGGSLVYLKMSKKND